MGEERCPDEEEYGKTSPAEEIEMMPGKTTLVKTNDVLGCELFIEIGPEGIITVTGI